MDHKVGQLVGAAGWNGDAATQFEAVWDEDAVALGLYASSLKKVSDALSTLGSALTQLQGDLNDAQGAAEKGGVRFTAAGDPVPGQTLTGAAQAAYTTYKQQVSQIQGRAHDARQTAKIEIGGPLSILDPESDPAELDAAGASNVESLMQAYYYMSSDQQQRKLAKDIAGLKNYYASLKKGGGEFTRKQRQRERAGVRERIKDLDGKLVQAEAYEEQVLKGKWFNSSVADLLHLDSEANFATKILDEVPVLDVLGLTVGTWAQMKYDHERGWSWTHALVADGSSNLVGIGVEIAAAETGPLAPVLGYAASSFVSELTHTVPWTQDIHNDGILGVAVGVGQGAKNVWANDVVGMGDEIADTVTDPVGTAKSIWHSIF